MTQAPSAFPKTPSLRLSQVDRAGLYRLTPEDLPAIRQAAETEGLAFYTVDLARASNVPGFLAAFGRDLGFPEWCGKNLDALNDCLSDFSWREARGYVIVLAHTALLRGNPTSLAALNEVLAVAVDEWKARDIPFWVFYLSDDEPRPENRRPNGKRHPAVR